MKFTKFIVAAFALVVGLTSCVEEPEAPAPVIKLGESTLSLDAAGGAETIGYMIENPVEGEKIAVSYEADWLTVNSAKVRSIEFSAPLNESGAERSVEVTISYKGAESVVVTVTQLYHESPLKIQISEVTATEVIFSVITDDKKLTWMPIVYTKEMHDYFDSEEALYLFDLEYLQYTADNRDETLEDFLEEFLAQGSLEDIFFDGLQPDTEYVLHAYGMETSGARTTEIVSVPFRTEVAWTGDITVAFEVEENKHVVYFDATPSHTGVPYFCHYATEQEIARWSEQYGTDDLKTLIQKGCINTLIQGLIDIGFTKDESGFYALFNNTGRIRDEYFPCKAGTKYTLFAGKWNEKCQLVGEISTYEFETAPVEPSNNKITLSVGMVTQSTAVVSTYTTNSDTYAIAAIETAIIENMTDQEIFEYAEQHRYLSEYTFSGNKTREFTYLTPDTDYTFVAFGYKAQSMTTETVSKAKFHTLPSESALKCTFEFDWDVREESVWVRIVPSDNGYYYHYGLYDARFTNDDVKDYISNNLIANGYEGDFHAFASWWLKQGTVTDEITGVNPDTEYKIGVVIMDYETGEYLTDVIFSETFKTPEIQYADISIKVNYGAYYDLDELSKAGYPEYKNAVKDDVRFSDGGAILPTEVEIKGNYQTFYYYVARWDLTDTTTYDDDMFYRDLQSTGSSNLSTIFPISYGVPWTVIAIAVDKDGNRTPTFRQLISALSKDGASPVEDFVATLTSAPSKSSVVEWTSYKSKAVTVEEVSDKNGRRNMLLSHLPKGEKVVEAAEPTMQKEFHLYSVK